MWCLNGQHSIRSTLRLVSPLTRGPATRHRYCEPAPQTAWEQHPKSNKRRHSNMTLAYQAAERTTAPGRTGAARHTRAARAGAATDAREPARAAHSTGGHLPTRCNDATAACGSAHDHRRVSANSSRSTGRISSAGRSGIPGSTRTAICRSNAASSRVAACCRASGRRATSATRGQHGTVFIGP